jgi:putative flippase GtrA
MSSFAKKSPRRRAQRQFAVFLVVGGACATVNFGVGAAVRAAVPIGVSWPSVAAGFVAGTLLSFALNRRYTFEVHEGALGPQAARFAVMSVASIALSAVVAEALDAALRAVPVVSPSSALGADLVHVGTIGLLFVFNFFAMKYFALQR